MFNILYVMRIIIIVCLYLCAVFKLKTPFAIDYRGAGNATHARAGHINARGKTKRACGVDMS